MMRTDLLAATFGGFLRMSKGERREFLTMLREWHLQRRIEAVGARGGDYRYRGPRTFADMQLDGVDFGPPAEPTSSEADFGSLGL